MLAFLPEKIVLRPIKFGRVQLYPWHFKIVFSLAMVDIIYAE